MPASLRCLLLASSCLDGRINCASFAPVFDTLDAHGRGRRLFRGQITLEKSWKDIKKGFSSSLVKFAKVNPRFLETVVSSPRFASSHLHILYLKEPPAAPRPTRFTLGPSGDGRRGWMPNYTAQDCLAKYVRDRAKEVGNNPCSFETYL